MTVLRLTLCLWLLAVATPAAPLQSHDARNPGGDRYTYTAIRREVAGAGGFGLVYYLPQPTTSRALSAPYPVFLFGHGKQLYGGSLLAPFQPLDLFYAAFLEHIARKGYIAAFPQMEAGLFDGDRRAQASRYLSTLAWLLAHEPLADTRRVIFAGHSMGADVALLAAALAGRGILPDLAIPPAVLAIAPVDEAVVHAALPALPPGTSVTLVTGDADTIAPPSGVLALGTAIPGPHRQVIELTSDHQVAPPLSADHNLSLTGGMLPALLGGEPRLDALDWYGTWKLAVGLLDATFRRGDRSWIWGARRLDGGTDGRGHQLRYTALLPPG